MKITVIICTHNPRRHAFARSLAGLAAQTLSLSEWELIVVDNASSPAVSPDLAWHPAARVVGEPVPGLTAARRAGIRAAQHPLLVFVDDDNVLAPGYLDSAVRIFRAHPALAAAGGPISPEWESPPPDWSAPFHGLLALRDLGPRPQIAAGGPGAPWPVFAPVGAGLVIRLGAAGDYISALAPDSARLALDRTGTSLASGGDNDLVFTALHAGGDIGYFPELSLTHLIPASRLAPAYLARLNEGIMRTWLHVLHLHGQCPWSAIPRWTVPLRSARAWFRLAAWRSPAHHIRWRGAVGQFQGQADLSHVHPLSR